MEIFFGLACFEKSFKSGLGFDVEIADDDLLHVFETGSIETFRYGALSFKGYVSFCGTVLGRHFRRDGNVFTLLVTLLFFLPLGNGFSQQFGGRI